MTEPPTAEELRSACKDIDPWCAVLDYMDGWAWPQWTYEQEAEIIASFYVEGED